MLKSGKISEAVLKRSVIKRIGKRRSEILEGAKVATDYSVIKPKANEVIVISTNPVIITATDDADRGVYSVAGDIAASGATLTGITCSVLLPEGYEESDLKTIMATLDATAGELNAQIVGGHTEVTAEVNSPIITITGIGTIDANEVLLPNKAVSGDDIILTKWIALEGTYILAKQEEKELKKVFSPAFVDRAIDYKRYLSVIEEALIAKANGAHMMHNVSRGGIYAALWELGCAAGCGLEVNLMSIPIKQESVEICEEYGINPYELLSGGSMLIAASNGYDIVRELAKAGINAAVIGKLTDSNDRVVINGDEKRFLFPPK